MAIELTNIEKKRGLPWICGSAAMNVIFGNLTVFGSVFILFLNELGLDKTKIGFLFCKYQEKGTLKLFKTRDVGSGSISGASIFAQIENSNIGKEKMKFKPVIEKMDKEKLFVIEIPNL